MDDLVASFSGVTGASAEKAQQYLDISDNNLEQAVELFFNTGGIDLYEQPVTQPPPAPRRTEDGQQEVIEIDSEDEQPASDDGGSQPIQRGVAETSQGGVPKNTEDDEAMARRLQEEFYGAGGSGAASSGNNDLDAEGYRAPIARRTETLVGGPEPYNLNDPEDMHSAVLEQLRVREQQRRRGKISWHSLRSTFSN